MARRINKGREKDRVCWSDLPTPHNIVISVIKFYHMFRSALGIKPCPLALEEIDHLGFSKHEKLVYVASVDKSS